MNIKYIYLMAIMSLGFKCMGMQQGMVNAINSQDLNGVKAFIQSTNFNVTDANGNNFLHLAIIAAGNDNNSANSLEIFKRILANANFLLNQKNNSGITPMDLAINNPTIFKLVVQGLGK